MYIFPRSATRTTQGGTRANPLPRNCVPELAGLGMSLNVTDPIHPTGASDMHAFRVMTFEVWMDSH